MTVEILIIVALALLNGVFSGAEIAVISVRRTRIHELIEEGSAAAEDLASLRDKPERFMATVQIVITLVGVLAGAFAGSRIAGDVAPVLAIIPGMQEAAPQVAFGLVTVLVVILQLVLGELVPKSLALHYAERYALIIARPLRFMAYVTRPLARFLETLSNLVLKPFGDRTTFSEVRLSREELLQHVEEAATAGSVDVSASEIASRALEFDDLDAATLMVPRQDIIALPRTISVAELASRAREGGHARLLIYDGEVDNIVGFINVREVLARAAGDAHTRVSEMVHQIPFVPETMQAPRVLRELQTRRSQIAVVVDEQGGVRGLVTMEDLLEELVGEIYSENDKPEEILRRQPDGSALVLGRAPVHEVARALEMDLPEGDTFSTMAGLVIDLAGRIPETGASFETEDGVILDVVEASPRRVRLVRVRRKPPEEDDEETAGAVRPGAG